MITVETSVIYIIKISEVEKMVLRITKTINTRLWDYGMRPKEDREICHE